ncbi:helix-turn-helix transcriptional regulator [Streptomyces sp. MBT49]|uniref:helix-turn-helix domain-containing protein n=1 Tax=Streptomyces sp. MBT49 TaxID=1488380 RepID=UPI001909A700|nr:helix-turn-helix transcriptional regulator [Streptomyces sp. MBT49]MBK3625905.1 helix-turn-helix transcriptional regulator [Streptomyces sp. MBT49]
MRASGVGQRIAYQRRLARMTQQQLADAAGASLGAVRKIEQGERTPSTAMLEAVADALGVDPSRLVDDRAPGRTRVHAALPALSAAIAAYDLPDDGPVRPLRELRAAVTEMADWRLAARYTAIARRAPELITELTRALASAAGAERGPLATLLIGACRSADAVAYKVGAHDLSARMIDLMRWAVPAADDPLLAASVAYVRTETFFAARAHAAGLRSLELALDSAPPPTQADQIAARGTLHMRAAVIAGRASDVTAAQTHLYEARRFADRLREGVYYGTAFGPDSVRIHSVSVAVGLGRDHVGAALDDAREWKPTEDLPAERRSGFYIDLARAQLWTGRPDHAFESLKVARHIAPQHTREHPWVRQDAATLRRLKRADIDELSNFAEWCAADPT